MTKKNTLLQRTLEEIHKDYDAGSWDDVAAGCRSLVAEHPDCGEAWFWMGMLSLKLDDPSNATVFFEQAHAAGLADGACLANLGEAYRRSGKIEAAREVLEEACSRDANSYGAWFNLASLYAEANLNELALARIDHLLERRPDDWRTLSMLGEVNKKLDRLDSAAEAFEHMLKLAPGDLEATLGLADVYRLKEDYVAAMARYEEVIRSEPNNLRALNGLAAVAVGLDDAKGGEAFYRLALTVSPDCWDSLIGLGMELTCRQRFAEAIEILLQTTQHHPQREDAWMRLGEAYFHSERLDDAMASYEAALLLNPDHVPSLVGVGNVHVHRQQWLEAVGRYERAAELAPSDHRVRSNIGQAYLGLGELDQASYWANNAVEVLGENDDDFVRFNRSVIDLSRGNLERGWGDYDCRESLERMSVRSSAPLWAGESLAGKRLLVWQDQGIGDQLVFATQFAEVVAQAGHVVIEAEPKLVSLLRRTHPHATVVPRLQKRHPMTQAADYQCAAGSLARWLRPTIASFPPASGPFVRVDAARRDYWRERLTGLSPLPKIGICWRSSIQTGLRKFCYAELDDWASIFRLHGVTLVNLQYDECSDELADIASRYGVSPLVFPELDMYNDLDETAAMISELDAVVSATTAVAWLSGAAGVVTRRLTMRADWLGLGQDINPWMNNVLRYRKASGETWVVPLVRIAADLVRDFGLPA